MLVRCHIIIHLSDVLIKSLIGHVWQTWLICPTSRCGRWFIWLFFQINKGCWHFIPPTSLNPHCLDGAVLSLAVNGGISNLINNLYGQPLVRSPAIVTFIAYAVWVQTFSLTHQKMKEVATGLLSLCRIHSEHWQILKCGYTLSLLCCQKADFCPAFFLFIILSMRLSCSL